MAQNIKRSICLTPGMLEELQIFASSKNITVAEAIRYLLERGFHLRCLQRNKIPSDVLFARK